MLDLGTTLPSFSLPDLNGRTVSDADFKGAQGLLVAFICKHCPFVQHIRPEFARFAKEYQAKGLKIVAIASNSVKEFPEDGPEGMKEEATAAGYTFPYLFDEEVCGDGKAGKAEVHIPHCASQGAGFDEQRQR